MSLVNRNVVRTILNTTETTQKTNDWNESPLDFNLTTGDFFYVGWRNRFTTRHFDLSVFNTTPSVVTVEFWNGTAWEDVDDLLDATNGFTKSGFISWQLATEKNWQRRSLDGIDEDLELFFVRMSVSVDLDAATKLQSVLNLFSDDEWVRIHYPEQIQNTSYLPPGRTNFLDIHVGAKDMVVTRMKQLKLIKDESEIIDINEVALAAAHAFLVILFTPIAVSDDNILTLNRAKENLAKELSRTNLHVDENLDGRISEAEKANTHGFITRRGDDFSEQTRRTRLHG